MLSADEGYFFGIGAFETIAVEEGKPILLKEHYARLIRAMEFFKIEHSVEEIKKELKRFLPNPKCRPEEWF